LYAGKTLLAVARIPFNPLSTVTTVTAEYSLETKQKFVTSQATSSVTSPVIVVTLALDTGGGNIVNQEKIPLMSPMATAIDEHDRSSDSNSSDGSSHSNSHDNSVKSARRSLVEQFSQVTMETGHQLLENSSDHSVTTPPATAPPPPTTAEQESSGASISSTSNLTDQITPSVTTNQIPLPIIANQLPSSIVTNQIPSSVAANQIPLSVTSNHINSANQDAHHYCIAIDVRSLRLLVDHMSSSMITGRYSYEFFGTSQPVMLPPINPTPFVECPFERSFCAFDFATPKEVLVAQLSNVPLIVELMQSAAVVGGAQVMMSSVLNQPKNLIGAEGSVSRQCIDVRSGITSW